MNPGKASSHGSSGWMRNNEWLIRFLLRFPTPKAVTALALPQFIELMGPLMGRRANKAAKIEEIYTLATRSIALPISEDSPAVATFRLQLERYLQLCEARQSLESQTETLLANRARTISGCVPCRGSARSLRW